MKKVLLAAVISAGLFFYAGSTGFAADYTVSATMPVSSGFVMYQVLNGTWSSSPTTSLTFGTLKEISVGDHDFIFLPDVTTDLYYVILPMGGGLDATKSVQVSFSDTGTISGLGKKTTISYVKVTDSVETEIKKARLQETSSVAVSSLGGAALRMYVGIYNGVPGSNWSGTAAEVFSGGDAAGNYCGTLTISVQ
ncbi:MAG: hypothetical protein PHC33_00175 [Candidatus Omnitrophica bacterium]|nr:hypothetical protein [Candidatus Omnitrophota bacterium]